MVKRVIADIVYSGPVRGDAHKSCRLERGGWPAITDSAGFSIRLSVLEFRQSLLPASFVPHPLFRDEQA